MFTDFKELNKFSVGRDYQQQYFNKLVFEKKVEYLKSIGKPTKGLYNPCSLENLISNRERIHDGEDVSAHYSVSLEDEKRMILERANNLEYLRNMTHIFESCRNTCKVPESRLRNIQFQPNQNQSCLTDCMNVKTELSGIKKPNNDVKTFVWLA